MRRILLSWNGINIYSYPAMLYVGLVAGMFAGAHVAQDLGMNPDRYVAATLILIIPALVGARLLFVLAHWDVYACEPRRIWGRGEGGMAMYGGLLLGVPLSIPLLRALDLPFAAFWDASTFTILIGMVFTRIGCLLNGCCSGRPTDAWFGLNLPDHCGVWRRRVPTQFIEMGFAAMLLAVALAMLQRAPFAGSIFCVAVAAYGVARLSLQQLRGDETMRGNAVIHIVSLLLVAAAAIGLIATWFW